VPPTPTPEFSDSLSQASTHWTVAAPACQFVPSSYQVSGTSTSGGVCLFINGLSLAVGDGTLTASVTITKDAVGFAGLIFRAGDGRTTGCANCYVFGVVSNGTWDFLKFVNGHGPTTIATSGSAAIHTGSGAVNTLTADFRGSHFQFTVNGTTVGQADDASLSGPGGIGVGVYLGMQAVYTNFAYSI
jgi:hypothetical protein